MDLLQNFLDHFNPYGLLFLLIQVAAVLVCVMVHELSHGLAACLLGDPTAKRAGRLSLNPLRHIDPMGFLMMLVVHVGWAKSVPVDMRFFKKPKRDMAVTALAGPVSNFILAFVALGAGSLLLNGVGWSVGPVTLCVILFLCYIAVLSVGLGIFNLIPIPPLDGSRLLSAVLPDKLYYSLMRYERYLMLAVIALAWFGVLGGPLNTVMAWLLDKLCLLTQFPFMYIQYYFGF